MLLLGGSAAAGADECASAPVDSRARVAYVYDGDTLRIADPVAGSPRIRVIGIDAPEVAHDNRPAEPLGPRARHALRRLLDAHQGRVGLRFGRQRHDRYGRRLAHVFLPDGTNVARWLLEQGLATTLVFPPNLWNRECYAAAQRRAQSARRGVWRQPPPDSAMQ